MKDSNLSDLQKVEKIRKIIDRTDKEFDKMKKEETFDCMQKGFLLFHYAKMQIEDIVG